MTADEPAAPTNIDQERADIDAGRAGDKIAFPDPAAAPLGTDAEAGGAPTTPVERRADQRSLSFPAAPARPFPWLVLWYGVAIAVLVVAILLMTALRR